MKLATILVCMLALGLCGSSLAQSIFNVPATPPVRVQQRQEAAPQPVQRPSGLQTTPMVDPIVMAQFEQMPNESNETYHNRLKALSQKSIADMERATFEHNEKMRALAAKKQ